MLPFLSSNIFFPKKIKSSENRIRHKKASIYEINTEKAYHVERGGLMKYDSFFLFVFTMKIVFKSMLIFLRIMLLKGWSGETMGVVTTVVFGVGCGSS